MHDNLLNSIMLEWRPSAAQTWTSKEEECPEIGTYISAEFDHMHKLLSELSSDKINMMIKGLGC